MNVDAECNDLNDWTVLTAVHSLKLIPPEKRTYSLCEYAVKLQPQCLEYVPESILDEPLALLGLEQSGQCIRLIPQHLLTKTMCLQAAETDGWAIKYIPDELIDYNLAHKAALSSRGTIDFIPDKYRDEQMIIDAVEANHLNMVSVRAEWYTSSLALGLVKVYPEAVNVIPLNLLCADIYVEALRACYDASVGYGMRTGFKIRNLPSDDLLNPESYQLYDFNRILAVVRDKVAGDYDNSIIMNLIVNAMLMPLYQQTVMADNRKVVISEIALSVVDELESLIEHVRRINYKDIEKYIEPHVAFLVEAKEHLMKTRKTCKFSFKDNNLSL